MVVLCQWCTVTSLVSSESRCQRSLTGSNTPKSPLSIQTLRLLLGIAIVLDLQWSVPSFTGRHVEWFLRRLRWTLDSNALCQCVPYTVTQRVLTFDIWVYVNWQPGSRVMRTPRRSQRLSSENTGVPQRRRRLSGCRRVAATPVTEGHSELKHVTNLSWTCRRHHGYKPDHKCIIRSQLQSSNAISGPQTCHSHDGGWGALPVYGNLGTCIANGCHWIEPLAAQNGGFHNPDAQCGQWLPATLCNLAMGFVIMGRCRRCGSSDHNDDRYCTQPQEDNGEGHDPMIRTFWSTATRAYCSKETNQCQMQNMCAVNPTLHYYHYRQQLFETWQEWSF